MYLCRFCIGVSFDFLINFLRWALFSYNYVLATLLKNNAKFIQKLNPGFKNHMSNLDNFRQAVESPKSWKFYGLIFSKMYITSAKILYEEDISNITAKYLCENSPNSLCHFWNLKSCYTTQLACIFIAQSLHTFNKSSPSKCKFSDFLLLELKFTKFIMPFFKQRVNFSSKFGSLLSVIIDTSSVLFQLKLYMLLTKVARHFWN